MTKSELKYVSEFLDLYINDINTGNMSEEQLLNFINLQVLFINEVDSEHIIKIINKLGQKFSYKELQELGLESKDD